MTELEKFKELVAKALIALAFVHVPILAAICFLLGRDIIDNAIACLRLSSRSGGSALRWRRTDHNRRLRGLR